MNIIKEYINEVVSFVKAEQKMDVLDYIVYTSILLLITLYIRNTQAQVCIINFNFYIALRLAKLMFIILISSTLFFNIYKLIKNKLLNLN